MRDIGMIDIFNEKRYYAFVLEGSKNEGSNLKKF